MTSEVQLPIGVTVSSDIECREDRPKPYKARIRWTDPATHRRRSVSESADTEIAAQAWIDVMLGAARAGVDPGLMVMSLADYGKIVMPVAMRGLELKTLDPYLAGWRKRVLPTLGHLAVSMITYGVVDRAVQGWIADGCSRSTIKNSLAVLVRVLEQAVRDGITEHNRGRVTGWQRDFQLAEDELDDPRSLALADYPALRKLADALVTRSADQYAGWADVVEFTACTAARISETSGVRRDDIDVQAWMWKVCRQTTPGPGGLIDKGTKGKRVRFVPIIAEIRPLVSRRLQVISDDPMARLFTGPHGGRITTAVLRDATHWDEVVTELGYPWLRRHGLRHTGLTWMADAGVRVHVLRKIAGHGSLTTTQRYLHPDRRSIASAGDLLSAHLGAS
jgi:integrase